ncbi:MAG: hypothetical protein LBT23_10655, partial [Synergistaceae bacterium]|nr:hypothetical protein [Synergistaceae bacterium]
LGCDHCKEAEAGKCDGPVLTRHKAQEGFELCAKLYTLGVPSQYLAEAYGISEGAMRKNLRNMGTRMRKPCEGFAISKEWDGTAQRNREIVALYNLGVPINVLVRGFILEESSIRYILEKSRVVLRDRTEGIRNAKDWKRRIDAGLDGCGGDCQDQHASG